MTQPNLLYVDGVPVVKKPKSIKRNTSSISLVMQLEFSFVAAVTYGAGGAK